MKISNVTLNAGDNFVPLSAPPCDPQSVNAWATRPPQTGTGAVRAKGTRFGGAVQTSSGWALIFNFFPEPLPAPQSVTCTIVWHEV